jgi:hypothetical protein
MTSMFETKLRNTAVALLALATAALTSPAVASANGVKSSVTGSINGGGVVIVKIAGRKVRTTPSGLFSISGKNLAGRHQVVFKSNGKTYRTTINVAKGSRLALQNVKFNSDGTASPETEDVTVDGTLTAVDCSATPNTVTITPSDGGAAVMMDFDPATTQIIDESTGTAITTCSDLAADVNDPVEAEGQQNSSGGITADQINVNPSSEDSGEDVSFSGTVTSESCPNSITVDPGTGTTITVNISSSTEIDLEGSDGQSPADCSSIPQGAQVDVEGVPQPDGSVNADKIEVMQNEFESDGTINSTDCVDSPQSLSFTPDGSSSALTVTIGSTTEIQVNDTSATCTELVAGPAHVEGVSQPDGSVAATHIEQGSSGD